VIFTLAFDTFAQEVIILRLHPTPDVQGAAIGQVPRAELYDTFTKGFTESSKFNSNPSNF